MWYGDDDVWHERLLRWACHDVPNRARDGWVIAMPDDDVYAEYFQSGVDITRLSQLVPDGSRPYLAELIYVFPGS